MKTIRIDASRSYDVVISSGLLAEAGRRIAALTGKVRAMVVSDDRVFPLYGETLTESLRGAGLEPARFVFPQGRARRTWPPTGFCWRSFAAFDLPAAT